MNDPCSARMSKGAKCAALAEPGFDRCSVHLVAEGYRRCPTCRVWLAQFQTFCPDCGGSHGATRSTDVAE